MASGFQTSSPETLLTEEDWAQLAARGIQRQEVVRQLRLLADPPKALRLDRPCRVGDGILRISETAEQELLEAFGPLPQRCRCAKFVPASGAASRMFAPIRSNDREAMDQLAERIDELPFGDRLREVLNLQSGQEVDAEALRHALLAEDGLGLEQLPKALIPFHPEPDGKREPRTALEDQLREAAGLFGGAECRVHLTVSPAHRGLFEEALQRLLPRLREELGTTIDVELSEQSPATDTVALDQEGGPMREPDGTLLLRPGGHGALIRNLSDLDADLVVIKNIDNILPVSRQQPAIRTMRLLLALLAGIVERQWDLQRRFAEGHRTPELLADAREFFHQDLMLPATESGEENAERLQERLFRPVRVCGMVLNTGEPGGGPFWVRGESGESSRQIVEISQIDLEDPEQASQVAAATHFNPVLLACSLRDGLDQAYELESFVDPRTSFVARKTAGARPLLALERPGLWNGAMAGWHTLFVEMPSAAFAPVKTVLDLLRDEHRI